MNTNRIFIGNIMYGKNMMGQMVLLKCKNDIYVALDDINTIIDIIKIKLNRAHLLTFSTIESENYYVDKNSLIPYYEKK